VKQLPIMFNYGGQLPIGKVMFSPEISLTDEQFKDMVLLPSYTTKGDGSIEILAYGLTKGEKHDN
jgi:hypothetical protein